MSNQNTNSFRTVGAGKTFLAPTDFIVQVDTSAGAVELVLPKIDTILGVYTTIQQFMGIRFVDVSNNASVNNITLTGFETDNINGATNIVLNTNGVGGILTLIGETNWSFTQNATGGGGTSGVASVTGLDTDNTDPLNPIVNISVDGTTITGDGTPANPLVVANQLYVDINYSVGVLNAVVEGGVAPYLYTWEMADIAIGTPPPSGNYFQYTSPTNTNSVTFSILTTVTPRFGSYGGGGIEGFVGLSKVTVTDSVGNKASDTFLLIEWVAS
jgi:hypothetical protein